MKKLLLLLLIAPVLGFGQGEQRYADGTATDQDGNTFEWINYGTQDWAIENANVSTFRDGSPIEKVTEQGNWNYNSPRWCNYDNDPNKTKLYNWWAVVNEKEIAPVGWRVPSDEDWRILEEYLVSNGYNFDGSSTIGHGNKLGQAIASKENWNLQDWENPYVNGPAWDPTLNNKTGFNAIPVGVRGNDGNFRFEGSKTNFWSKTWHKAGMVWRRGVHFNDPSMIRDDDSAEAGYSIRFVRDASTASTNDYSNTITIYPNPTTSIVTLQGDKEHDIEVYNLQGNKVMELTGNKIDMSHLSSATYIVKALDKVKNEEVSYKVVKN